MREPIITRDVPEGVWVLVEDYEIRIRWGVLLIRRGFRFDMASVPRIFWRIIAPHELGLAAPLVHDYFYQCRGRFTPVGERAVQLTRSQVDQVFYEMMTDEGVGWRRKPGYFGVRVGGWLPWWRAASRVEALRPAGVR